jgi:hypothetical protein
MGIVGNINLIQVASGKTGKGSNSSTVLMRTSLKLKGEEFHLRITSFIGPFRIDRYSTRQLHCLNASSILARVRGGITIIFQPFIVL